MTQVFYTKLQEVTDLSAAMYLNMLVTASSFSSRSLYMLSPKHRSLAGFSWFSEGLPAVV